MSLVGGFSAPKPVDDDVNALVADENIKAGIAQHLNEAVTSIEVESYQTQVVAGVNYKIAAKVNGSKQVHITIYKALPHTGKAPEVTKVEASS